MAPPASEQPSVERKWDIEAGNVRWAKGWQHVENMEHVGVPFEELAEQHMKS